MKTENEWTLKCKDNSPEETVDRIKKILQQNGFTDDYQVINPIKGCYSSRLELNPANIRGIGSNGKGTTEEFCKASAYAELMERLQSLCLFPFFIDKVKETNADSETLAEGVIDIYNDDELPLCIKDYFKKMVATANVLPCFEKTAERKLKDIIADYYKSPRLRCINFWSCREKKKVLLPYDFLLEAVGSNGMAAGNTVEEAIVQGGCEIFERYVTYSMLKDGVVFPEFPDEVIDRFPYIRQMIREINSRGDYEIRLYDASLGKGLPVACGIIINKKTGRLAFKLGSHTSLAVALERIFTEIFQGRDLNDATATCTITFAERNAKFKALDLNMIKAGCAPIRPELLINKPDYEYKGWEWDCCDTSDNKLMSSKVIDTLDRLSEEVGGYGVYILDNSILGFPTVHLYVPGISEVTEMDMDYVRFLNQINRTAQLLSGNEDILNPEDLDTIRYTALKLKNRLLENNYPNLAGVQFTTGYPKVKLEMNLLAAICLYAKGEYKKAFSEISKVAAYEKRCTGDEEASWISAVETYTGAVAGEHSHGAAEKIVRTLYTSEIADQVIYQFSQPEKTLKRVYPHCNNMNCKECRYRINCNHKAVEDLWMYLLKKRKEFVGKRYYDSNTERDEVTK